MSSTIDHIPLYPEMVNDVPKHIQQTERTDLTAKPKIGNSLIRKGKSEKLKCYLEHRHRTCRNGNRHWQLCEFCAKRHRYGRTYCPGFQQRCRNCSKMNHTSDACWFRCSKQPQNIHSPSLQEEQKQETDMKDTHEHVEIELIEREIPTKAVDSSGMNSKIEEEGSELSNEAVALHWINEKLKTRHKSLGEFKDGKSA